MPVLRGWRRGYAGVGSGFWRSLESGRFYSARVRRHAAGVSAHGGARAALGSHGNEGSAPMIWNTSIVHLTLGFVFCWWFGKGNQASERSHLLQMIATQLLLCQGVLAMPARQDRGLPVMCSPRGVLLEVRREMGGRTKPSNPFTQPVGAGRSLCAGDTG